MILRRWSTSLLETGQNLWGAREGPSTGERRLFFEKNRGAQTFFRKKLGGWRLFFEKCQRGESLGGELGGR